MPATSAGMTTKLTGLSLRRRTERVRQWRSQR